MTESFDTAASAYDTIFTNSPIGKLQRAFVYDFLSKHILKDEPLRILEINCGTGHDALWLSDKGHNVIATDISPKMVAVASAKNTSNSPRVSFSRLDINALDQTSFDESFDLIFSNFGGLNCLSPAQLKLFLAAAARKLKPQGKIAAVIMPKACVLESLYFIAKGHLKQAFRRRTKTSVIANVDGVGVKTWYYAPKDIIQFGKADFKYNRKSPIGFCIPPSYLDPFFKNKLSLLNALKRLERLCYRLPFLAQYSDHYIISISKL